VPPLTAGQGLGKDRRTLALSTHDADPAGCSRGYYGRDDARILSLYGYT
jgi:hypothetical protein